MAPGPGQPPAHALRAVSVPLGPGRAVDPLAVAGEDGVLFAGPDGILAGRGVAARLPLPTGLAGHDAAAVGGWLAAVAHDDRCGHAGPSVTALGALPFDPSAPAALIVPELLYRRDAAGRSWVTLVGPAPGPEPDADRALGPLAGHAGAGGARPPDAPGPPVARLTADPPGTGYADAVGEAVAAIAAGSLAKVVLARSVELAFDEPVPTVPALARLRAAEPTCTVFSYAISPGRFLGASPELLVRRRGPSVLSQPLAGTVALDADDPAAEARAIERFLASAKDRVEHELVVADIVSRLRLHCASVDDPGAPALVRLHTVAHLGTPVRATLAGGADDPSALELAAVLHPTPAVGGVPRGAALAWIARLEPMARGQWAGPVGWVDARGDGDWMIGIRSATVAGRRVTCLAGAGIVAGSDPAAELAETTVKLAPVVEAFDPGATGRL